MTLGHYPDVSLAAARRENARLKAPEAQGIDTAQARKEEKAARIAARAEQEQAAGNTFQTVALEWMGIQKNRWRPSHATAMRNALANNAFPLIGDRPVDQLTPPDIVAVLRAIEARGAYGMASKVLGGIHAACRYAVQTGRAVFNPAADMGGVIVAKKVEHHKALSKEAMPDFLQALRENAYIHPITKAAIRFTILTAARSGETRLATWPEIDFEAGLWRIPAERMKAADWLEAMERSGKVEPPEHFLPPTGGRPDGGRLAADCPVVSGSSRKRTQAREACP